MEQQNTESMLLLRMQLLLAECCESVCSDGDGWVQEPLPGRTVAFRTLPGCIN
jgi:hypothetical protein